MVQVADALKGKLTAAGGNGVAVYLTGASAMWSDFNTANRNAMMKSELYSWPVTLAILALAFGALVAAGLPLMLTIVGLVAAAGSLYIASQIGEVSIWAMNFALMFALALGIDYALFIVNRFRGALFGSRLDPVDAVAVTMDTAGKAVLFSGATVLISLSAVMLVPSPAFRSMALGIMLAVVFILAASLTLLPATLAKLGPKVDKGALRWVHSGEHRSPAFAALGRTALAPPDPLRDRRARDPARPRAADLRAPHRHALDQGRARPATPPARATRSSSRPSAPARPGSSRSSGRAARPPPPRQSCATTPASPASSPAQTARSGQLALIEAVPRQDPSSKAVGSTIDRLRAALPAGMLVGGATAENHDLEQALSAKTPLVIGVVLGLGFLLLLIALQAPVIAAVGVLTNLLAVGAAFGVARLIFQNGHGAGLLGFEPQGFIDAWGPVFFFAMIFAISMDYTVFLLSSAKEHWDRNRRPERRRRRRTRPLRPRHLRRRRRHDRRLLHLRPLRTTPAQGDGRHPRHRRPPRRHAHPTRPRSPSRCASSERPPGRSPTGSAASSPTSASATNPALDQHRSRLLQVDASGRRYEYDVPMLPGVLLSLEPRPACRALIRRVGGRSRRAEPCARTAR